MPVDKKAPYKRTQVLIGFALVVLVFAVAILFGAIFFQEGNPVPVVQALSRLEFSDESVTLIPGEPVKFVAQAGSTHEPLTDYLSEHGWHFQDRLGAAILYGQGQEVLYVETRMLTRRYVVYELDRAP